MAVDLFLGLLCLLTILLGVTFVRHLFFTVPFVPTPMNIVDAMIEAAHLKGGEVVYDLGAGDARFLIRTKQRFPTVIAKGCECILSVWFLGKLRIWWSNVHVLLTRESVWTMDIRSADVVFLYLLPWMLERLASRFDRELKRGTRVISNTFQFPGREPAQVIVVGKKKVYVYKW